MLSRSFFRPFPKIAGKSPVSHLLMYFDGLYISGSSTSFSGRGSIFSIADAYQQTSLYLPRTVYSELRQSDVATKVNAFLKAFKT